MRTPEYLSPTSIKLFFESPREFYLRYLADTKIPRDPQTQAMAIGSAFDAYVKSELYEIVYGKGHNPEFDLETIFDKQVEPQHRDWGRKHGWYLHKVYHESGAFADLLLEIQNATSDPRFEIEIRGLVDGIPLLGKPDTYYVNRAGHSVIRDWKVNGYVASRNTSPMKGYINLRERPFGRTTGKAHKEADVQMYQGCTVNMKHYLEDLNVDWAVQLAIYLWLIGESVGTQSVIGIDQIVANGTLGAEFPEIRIAEHSLRIRADYQKLLLAKIKMVWNCIKEQHIFTDMTKEDSQEQCRLLDKYAEEYDPEFERMIKS